MLPSVKSFTDNPSRLPDYGEDMYRPFQGLQRLSSRLLLAVVLSATCVSSVYAAPRNPGGGDGGGSGDIVRRAPGGGGRGIGGGIVVPPVDCTGAIVTFTAGATEINLGETTSLYWSVQLPPNCPDKGLVVNDAKTEFKVGLSGTMSVSPMFNTFYALQVPGVSTIGSLTINVRLPSTVDINGSSAEWAALLAQAVGTDDTTVRLAANVDMEIPSGLLPPGHSIRVAHGVTLMGGQPCRGSVLARAHDTALDGGAVATSFCGARTSSYPGPRVYVKEGTTLQGATPLFDIGWCDQAPARVRFTGFRVQGPHWDPADGENNLEQGIRVQGCKGVEIDNMELSGWSGSAVRINNERDGNNQPIQTAPSDVRVHDNFIHHNQHIGGDGYGVDASAGSWALIERNVFDYNRHAVTAGNVQNHTWEGGWSALQNLVLKGGGWHGTFWSKYTPFQGPYQQQFDVHGDKNCSYGWPWGTSHLWNCGRSGVRYEIRSNAFQYDHTYAFNLRGTPLTGAFVNDNIFTQSDINDASTTDGHGTIGLNNGPNTLGKDTFGQYGVCDFDGSGVDGLFLATGNSWWYMNRAKQHWTFLNSQPETLDHLALGHFTGSRVCDVFTERNGQWLISEGGKQPFRPFGRGNYGVPFDQLRFGHFTDLNRTEIFRRAPDGSWWIISPGIYDWTHLGGSSFPLSDLRFGSFSGDGYTDVLGVSGGKWSVSHRGRSTWDQLNPSLGDRLNSVLIGDLRGVGTDDVIRYVSTSPGSGRWEVSWGGRTTWQPLATKNWPVYPSTVPSYTSYPSGYVWNLVGHFVEGRAAQLLMVDRSVNIDLDRRGQILNLGTHQFDVYSKYAY